MKRRILSMVIVLVMMFSLIVVPNTLGVSASNFYDTVGTNVELAADVVSVLGIMGGYTDGSFLPYNTITKAELAAVAVKLAGLESYGEEAPDDMELFKDMYDYEGWATGVVAAAKSAGIAKADSEGNFNPDMSATYEDAMQMIVSALGYGYQAMDRGGEPGDYVYVARRLGLTKNLDTALGQNVTRGDVAKIVYAALTVDLMEPVSFSADGTMVDYKAVSGKNALNTYFDVYETKGIITENEYAAIDGESTVDEEQVLINDEAFNVGNTDIASYLGYYATVYALEADEEGNNRTIIAFGINNTKNNTLTIEAEDIENVTYSPAGYVFEYWSETSTKNKVKEVETSSTPLVLYNGKAEIDVATSLLKPDNGYVTFIDNNGDDVYDIVDVWEYELVYVFSVSQASGSVTNSYARSDTYRFNPESEDYRVTFLNTQGGMAKLSDIKQYSVLYVYQSSDLLEKKVVISNNQITGTVQEVSADGYYTINGTEYEISPGAIGKVELAVTDTGSFYLDADNRIAGFEGTTVIRKNIGMFIDINNGGFEKGYQIKLLTQNNGVQIYNLANTIKVNDDILTSDEFYELAFKDALFGRSEDPNYATANLRRPNPAKAGFLYKLNSKGQINEVVVVGDGKDGYLQTRRIGLNQRDSKTLLYYSKNFGCLHYSAEKIYNEYGEAIGGVRTYCDDKTVNFCVQEADYKTEGQSFYTSYMSAYWENYQFADFDWIYAYYYSDDESVVDMQTTVCNFLVMADWYVASSDSTEDTSKNTYATSCQPDLAPKFIQKVTAAYDRNEDAQTVRVYYYDGTGVRNALVRPKYYKDGEGHIDNDINKDYLPAGFPVRISTDGAYIEDIAPFYDTLYFDMYEMVKPIYNTTTGTWITPFQPFFNDQWRKWNSWDDDKYQYNIRHYCGIITSIDKVVNNKLFSLAAATGSSGKKYSLYELENERLEGTVYKLNFDRQGYIESITRGSLDDIVPGQFVIVRKRAHGTGSGVNWEALSGYAVNEFFIISDDASELDYLHNFYTQVQEEIIAE